MRRGRFAIVIVSLALVAALTPACRGILGVDDPPLVSSDGGGNPGDGSNSGDATIPGDDTRQDGSIMDGSTIAKDSGKEGGNEKSVGSDWATFPMPASSPGAANYTLGTDTALDLTTGMMWQRGYSDKVVFASAATTCAAVTDGGFHDWRVPTWIELATIVDYGLVNPSIDPTAFGGTPNDWFWSSTITGLSTKPMGVNFGDGVILPIDLTTAPTWRVRCVRKP